MSLKVPRFGAPRTIILESSTIWCLCKMTNNVMKYMLTISKDKAKAVTRNRGHYRSIEIKVDLESILVLRK